ncbi:MAG: LPS export ABC transporter periplasmic protein LptC [Zymomonas mobilis]|uniref:LPS export ABC transporter periplasmic protein LptC n=1 Tax=Zymomonas mobilis TaxID=542 RepID=UPI0039EAD913
MPVMAPSNAFIQRRWALAGGSHDRIIHILRIILPVAIIIVVAMMAITPLIGRRDLSFMLSRDHISTSKERMNLKKAIYRGHDDHGRVFELKAESATQPDSSDPQLWLTDLVAEITLDSGPATVTAPHGRYNMDNNILTIDGTAQLVMANGYRVNGQDVVLDLDKRLITSQRPVSGQSPNGHFQGQSLNVDLINGKAVMDGRTHTHFDRRSGD